MHMQRWEYNRVSALTNDANSLTDALNDLGQYGWEVVGFASADKTLGLNAIMAILKRPVVDLDDPSDRSEGWKDDPSQRWHVRWWDGEAWTHHVGRRDGEKRMTGRDAPTRSPQWRKPNF